MRQFNLLLVLLLFVACNQSDNQEAQVKASITQVHSQLQEAYIRSDAQSIANCMTDSVIISPIGMKDIVGRKAMQDLLAGFFQGGNSVSKYEFTPVELETHGKVAYSRGTYVWRSVDKGGSPLNSTGRYYAVHFKGPDGSWRLHRLIENELPPSQ